MYDKIAALILILHFGIIIFITSLFFLVPIGYKYNWQFVKNKKLRIIHLGLITFISLETVLGLACPLTYLENFFLEKNTYEFFLSYWISQIIYWNLPSSFFIILYLICFIWTIKMWQLFPPRKF